jgi:hypothetical protein
MATMEITKWYTSKYLTQKMAIEEEQRNKKDKAANINISNYIKYIWIKHSN